MSDVLTDSQYLTFINDNIFNVISENPSMKDNVVSRINAGQLKIPTDLEHFVFKYLGILPDSSRSRYRKLSGEALHEYLMERVSFQQIERTKFPSYSTRNIEEIVKFLKKDGQSLLRFNEQTLFYNQCRFGYVLERLFYLHKEKHQKKEIKETCFLFLFKYSNISASYARKLRTVGRIWYEYKGLGNLAISFIEFYQRKNEIILLLKNYPNLFSTLERF